MAIARDQQIRAYRRSATALGALGIDMLEQLKPLSQIIQGGDGAKVSDHGVLRFYYIGALGHGGDDVIGLAEVLLPEDLRLAVDPLAFAGIVVGRAANEFCGYADHGSSYTTLDRIICKAWSMPIEPAIKAVLVLRCALAVASLFQVKWKLEANGVYGNSVLKKKII